MTLNMIELFGLLFSASLDEITKYVENHPKCLEIKGPSGQSALWFAIETNREDVVKLLLDLGANPSDVVTYCPPIGKGGVTMTPLMNAKSVPILLALVSRGARMNDSDSMGRSVMYHLSSMGNPDLVLNGLNLGGKFRENEVARIRASFSRELARRAGYSARSRESDQRCQSLQRVLEFLG